MTWCEHCRDHYDVGHYTADGSHKLGDMYGPTGDRMERERKAADVPRIVRAVLESPSFEGATVDQRVQWIVNALAPVLPKR